MKRQKGGFDWVHSEQLETRKQSEKAPTYNFQTTPAEMNGCIWKLQQDCVHQKNPLVTNNKPCLGKHGEILSPVLGEGAPMFVLKAFVESEKE